MAGTMMCVGASLQKSEKTKARVVFKAVRGPENGPIWHSIRTPRCLVSLPKEEGGLVFQNTLFPEKTTRALG